MRATEGEILRTLRRLHDAAELARAMLVEMGRSKGDNQELAERLAAALADSHRLLY